MLFVYKIYARFYYDMFAEEVEEGVEIRKQEHEHERALLDMLDEERF